MTIIGIGMDIVAISRIESILSHSGDKLATRILSSMEWQKYQSHIYPARFLAKRFAAKEAAFKAFGTGIRNNLAFSQCVISNDELGKPSLQLFGKSAILANYLGITNMLITLTDEKYYACATVIFEKN